MTTDARDKPPAAPPLGLSLHGQLGPLPEPFGWLHDGLPNGGLAFQKHAPDGFQALVLRTMPVYSHAQMLAAMAAERERCAKLCEDAKPRGGRMWTDEQAACFDCLTHVAAAIRA